MRIPTLTAVAIVIALAGCAGTNYTADQVAQVRNGMTEAEVIAILGQPYQRIQMDGKTAILTWSHATAFGGAKAASFRFQDGRVASSTTIGK